MDDIQLKVALVDLAEYGYVVVETQEDARQVAEMVREVLKDGED
jgi:hypothetical protein